MKNLFYYSSPIGTLGIAEKNNEITNIYFSDTLVHEEYKICETPILSKTAKQLEEYFAGKRKIFDVPIKTSGTEFQLMVWDALKTIPYGEIRSYIQIATQIGRPKASRPTGMANSVNKIPIIIPCHRVIGASGSLVGYAGGLDIKKQLLDLEQKYI